MNNFLNLNSDQGILDKHPSPGIIDLNVGRDSSCEVVEDKNSKMQKIQEIQEIQDMIKEMEQDWNFLWDGNEK